MSEAAAAQAEDEWLLRGSAAEAIGSRDDSYISMLGREKRIRRRRNDVGVWEYHKGDLVKWRAAHPKRGERKSRGPYKKRNAAQPHAPHAIMKTNAALLKAAAAPLKERMLEFMSEMEQSIPFLHEVRFNVATKKVHIERRQVEEIDMYAGASR